MEYIWETRKTLSVPANTISLGFRIDAPPAGRVTRLVVKQLGTSNLTNFSVRLFSLPVVALVPNGQPPSDVPEDNAAITPTFTANAGSAAVYMSDGKGYCYRNMFSGKYTKPDRAVYLKLTLSAQQAVQTNWLVTLVVVAES